MASNTKYETVGARRERQRREREKRNFEFQQKSFDQEQKLDDARVLLAVLTNMADANSLTILDLLEHVGDIEYVDKIVEYENCPCVKLDIQEMDVKEEPPLIEEEESLLEEPNEFLDEEDESLNETPPDGELDLVSARVVESSSIDTARRLEFMRISEFVAASGRGRPRKKARPNRRKVEPKKMVLRKGPRQKTGTWGGMIDHRGLGPRAKVWLEGYDETKTRLVAAGANYAYYEFHINDLFKFDPGSATGVVFTGNAEFSAFFAQYIVLGARISWQVGNLDNSQKQTYLLPSPQSITALVTSAKALDILAANLVCPLPLTLSAMGGGSDIKTINRRIPAYQKFYGDPIQYRAAFSSGVGGSPTNYLYMGIASSLLPTSLATNGIFSNLRVSLKVEFFDRKMLQG
jgi:hypothetical protein